MDEQHVHERDMDDINVHAQKHSNTDINEKHTFIQFEKGWTTNIPKTLECLKIKNKSPKLITCITRP